MSETKQPYDAIVKQGRVTASIYPPDDWTPIIPLCDVTKQEEPPTSFTAELEYKGRLYKGVLYLVEEEQDHANNAN